MVQYLGFLKSHRILFASLWPKLWPVYFLLWNSVYILDWSYWNIFANILQWKYTPIVFRVLDCFCFVIEIPRSWDYKFLYLKVSIVYKLFLGFLALLIWQGKGKGWEYCHTRHNPYISARLKICRECHKSLSIKFLFLAHLSLS